MFVDTDGDVRIIRRLLRDVQEKRKRFRFCSQPVLEYS